MNLEVANFLVSHPELAREAIDLELARRDILDFTTYTKKDYQVNWHHAVISKAIEDFMADDERTRMVISLPPRRGKSELVSLRLPAYLFGKNPNINIIGAAYADSLAKNTNLKIQRIMESNEYQNVFPETRLMGKRQKNLLKDDGSRYTRTATQFDIVGHTGSYRAAGIGSGINGMGADLIIIDDPFKDWAEANSDTVRNGVKNWYTSVALNRLTPKGKVIIIHTRWHEDDLIGSLLADAEADPESDQFEVICIPETFTIENKYIHPQDPRKTEGELLWPNRYDEKWVTKRRKALGSVQWEALFQQNPTSAENAIFKPTWFQYYKTLPVGIEYYASSWDCSFKDLKSSDFVAGTVWGVKGANKYLVYIVHEQMGIIKTIEAMLRVNNMFKLRFTLVEDKANGTPVIELMKDKIPAMLKFSAIDSKASRAQAAAPQFEAGNIWLPDKFSNDNKTYRKAVLDKLDVIVKEFQRFMNGGKKDDIVDSAVQFILHIGNKVSWADKIVAAESEGKSSTKQASYNSMVSQIMGWENTSTPEFDIVNDTEDMFKIP